MRSSPTNTVGQRICQLETSDAIKADALNQGTNDVQTEDQLFKIYDVLERLRIAGLPLDENLFEQVRHKMDMFLPERHKLRIALKILKTRYRKLKRRERRKECRLLNDSLSLDEESE